MYHSEAGGGKSIGDRFAAALATHAHRVDREALTALGTEWLDQISTDSLHEYVRGFREAIEQAPTMVVYVPCAFDAEAEAVLGEWCRAELAERTLLQLEIDPQVVGGCSVIANNTLHEYSLAARLREQPGTISKLLRAYE